MGPPGIRQALRARIAQVDSSPTVRCSGVVTQVVGAIVESEGPAVALGDLCEVETGDGDLIRVQVVGFRENRVLSMPLDEPGPLQPGRRIVARRTHRHAPAGPEVLGRVLDGFGRPADGAGPLHTSIFRDLYLSAPGPLDRKAISEPLATGVRVIDGLLPCGKGQRVGIFGGSGVGKTTLLGAMARASEADVNVIALIGERNREVRAFLDETLGAEGLARSVVIAATSDRPAPVRVRATFLATAIAEAFRDRGKNVLLIMDSVTRLAMAQREIGLAAGEPPSGKGYTPSVFQMLPKIFERAGNFASGSITGFYTVLVEGDDMNDPIADAARAVLDGHIVLSRELAAANHYPAVDALESVSRLAQSVAAQEHLDWASRLRDSMATYRRSEDLINLGAYAGGSNPAVDSALAAHDDVVSFLKQDLSAHQSLDETLGQLQALAQKL